MTTVILHFHQTTSRVPFRAGTYRVQLEDDGSRDYKALGTTRGHATWEQAARAALGLADRRGYLVANRALIELKLASEKST